MRFHLILASIICSFLLASCSKDSSTSPTTEKSASVAFISFEGWTSDISDSVVDIVPGKSASMDSLVLDSLSLTGDGALYVALDDDAEDPAISASPLSDGSVLAISGVDSVRLVLLNSKDVIVQILTVRWDLEKSSSSAFSPLSSSSVPVSSSAIRSSSSATSASSASSSSAKNSSSSVFSSSSKESSSSVKSSASGSSSSSVVSVVSSSSEEISSSSALSSQKSLVSLQIKVNGTNAKLAMDSAAHTVSFSVSSAKALDSIQVVRLSLSSGATSDLLLSTDLLFSDLLNSGTATYAFHVTAEDGSSDSWTMLVTYPLGIYLSDLAFDGGTVSFSGTKIYVEVPYGTDISALTVSPLDSANDLRDWKSFEFVDASGVLQIYEMKAGYQLPGSDFTARDDSFWATTSDAMATEGDAKVLLSTYKTSASADLSFADGAASLTTAVVSTSLIGIVGGKKMAGAFYYSGSFSGANALSIYDADYSSGIPDLNNSDISSLMTFGKSFTARPDSFSVTYSYTHISGDSQKSLIYVMLVSADNKVVATGSIMDEASVSGATKTVALHYGSDPDGLLSGDYPVSSGLSLGTGSEEVASIHVMFASSAYAHIVSTSYKGAEGAVLTVDNLKLIY